MLQATYDKIVTIDDKLVWVGAVLVYDKLSYAGRLVSLRDVRAYPRQLYALLHFK